MANWLRSFGTIYHGLQGRWRMGGLNPAVKDDEAVTKAQLDEAIAAGVGSAFPFEGDATIDGTLNIDFTDTLDFFMGNSLELEGDPTVQAVTKGDMIGFLFKEGGHHLFSGIVDGVTEVFGGLAEVGIQLQTTGFKDLDTGDFVGSIVGRTTLPPELGGGVNVDITPVNAVFVDGDEAIKYEVRASKNYVDGSNSLYISKSHDDGDDTVTVRQELADDMQGFLTENDSPDPDFSVHRFENEEGDSILDLLNEALQSDVLLSKDFADDAAAEAGDVPIGGLYHNNGALRIRQS